MTEVGLLKSPAHPQTPRGIPTSRFPSGTILFVVIAVLAIELFIKPSGFDDFASYSYFVEGLRFGYPTRWWEFEPLSSGLMLGLRLLTGDADLAIDVDHYMLAAAFIAGMYLLARRYRAPWQAVLLVFAAFGPLLAFVTLRATPAYFLMALAAHSAARGKAAPTVALAAPAVLFHLSSVLAVPPLLLCFLQGRFGALAWLNRRGLTIVLAAVGYGALMSLFRGALLSTLLGVVNSVPVLGKYVVYLTSVDDAGQAESTGASAFHLVYWAATAAFMVLFMIIDDARTNRFKGYIVVSYLTFVFLLFSPVSAYRQSIFWMTPAILLFPWRRLNSGVLSQLALVAGCVGLFAVGFSKVLV